MTDVKNIFAAVGIVAVLATLMFIMVSQPSPAVGSIIQGNEYRATSTGEAAVNGEITSGEVMVKGATTTTAYGSLAQVVITGSNTGLLHFYDATTTDATERDASQATATIHIASIAASAAENTYVFDASFSRGLLLVVEGTAPSSTILYR